MESPELILVVDDEITVREMIRFGLSERGYTVETAASGYEALDLMANKFYPLVVTDLMLPGLSGLDVLAQIKALQPMTEVILVTAHGSVQTAVEALRYGARDYLIKPFSYDELLHSVGNTLEYRRLKLERESLVRSLEQQRDELKHMLAASQQLASLNLQPAELLDGIVAAAVEHLGLDVAITAFLNECQPGNASTSGALVQTKAADTFEAAWKQWVSRVFVTPARLEQLFAQAQPINQAYLVELHEKSTPNSWLAQASLPKVPALVIPLRTLTGQLIGALWVTRIIVPPAPELLQRLEIFANQVTSRLENANLFARQTRQVSTRNALVAASQRMTMVLDRQEIFSAILEATLEVLPMAELVAIYYQADEELKVLGFDHAGNRVDVMPAIEAQVDQVLHTRQAIYQPFRSFTPSALAVPGEPVEAQLLIIEPLALIGVPLGALAIITQGPVTFDDEYSQILTMLISQATIALQNARLYTEACRVDELEALYEAGQALNRSLDLQETLTNSLIMVRDLTGASVCNIYLRLPDVHHLNSVITLDEDEIASDADRRQATALAQAVFHEHRAYAGCEPKLISAIRPPQAYPDDTPAILTWLAVPLLQASNSLVGVLEVGSLKQNFFTKDDIRLMQVFAVQSAAAIENALLYEQIRQRLQQTEALGVISQTISNTLDLRRVLDLVVQSAVKTIPVATYSTLYLFDKEHNTFMLEAKAGKEGQSVPAELDSVRRQVIQQVTQQKTSVRLTSSRHQPSAWSLLIAPLTVHEKVIGVISVESPQVEAFLSNDEALLNTFASHASTAIQNANLFRELSVAYHNLAQHQAEILHSHKTLQALFDGITDGLYIVDREMRIMAINQAERQRLGRPSEALLGRVCDETIWGEAAPTIRAIIDQTFETGNEGNWTSDVDTPQHGPFADREVRTYPIFMTPSPDMVPVSEVSRVILLAQDISEKRRLWASLFRSANMAAVGRLAASIAHQINNPLTVIIGNMQLMEMELDPGSPDYPVIKYILDASNQIRQIIANLLDFSTQNGYDWFETDVTTTIDEALALIIHSLHKNRIQVIQEIAPISPITASASHLKLLWMNLILNARDAILENGQEGCITIRAEQARPDQVRVQILDDGTGVAPENRENLFQPFFTTKAHGQGLGLGLYTCRTIVEQHHGCIELTNLPEGHGAVATVLLPVEAFSS